MEEVYNYKTVTKISQGLYKEKGSKFIAFLFPVQTEEQFKEKYSAIKKEYHDARHHCYAYRLDPENETVRSSDDGEPSGTAGKPMLNQLYSFELFNVGVVVVRYFGGTKLGVSGLINAYKQATIDAIENNHVVTRYLTEYLKVEFAYPLLNEVMRVVKEEKLKIREQKFEMECMVGLEIKKSEFPKVYDRLSKIRGLNIKVLKNNQMI
jgi:uncharacterized YigZ family protein